MALIIVYISFFGASIYGIAAMAYFGDGFLTSTIVDQIIFAIVSIGVASALLCELGQWYLSYRSRKYPMPDGKIEH